LKTDNRHHEIGSQDSFQQMRRLHQMPNRVIGNVFIAAGALLIGPASTLTRLGYGQFLYLGELLCRSTIHSSCRGL